MQALFWSFKKLTLLSPMSVNKKRQESSLSTLDVSVINLVADDADTAATVSAATKLGSTGIRGWLAKKATAADDQKK